MSTPQVIVRDLGWKQIKKNMKQLDNMAVDVGVQSDAGANDEGTSIAFYGSVNEFGSSDGRVPERSFMRSTFDENIHGINNTVKRLRALVERGRIDAEQAGGMLGEYHQRQIQEKIRSGVPPANAPSTIKRKGSSKTLIDDGILRGAIRYEVRQKAPWWKFW